MEQQLRQIEERLGAVCDEIACLTVVRIWAELPGHRLDPETSVLEAVKIYRDITRHICP